MQIKALFLGTGTSQGVPVIGCNCVVCQSNDLKDKRLRSSLLLSIDNYNILIDVGPDFRYQILRSNNFTIDSVLFTHQHRDHTAGLDDLRPIYYLNKKPILLYAEKNVCNAIKKDFSYMFSDFDYPGRPTLNFQPIENKPFYISNFQITPIRVMHYKLPVFGYRIADIAYITDANYISELEKKKLLGLEILILNSLQKENHISHYNLKQSLDLIKELNPKKAYLTHISHDMGRYDEVIKELPKNVFLSYDNLELSL